VPFTLALDEFSLYLFSQETFQPSFVSPVFSGGRVIPQLINSEAAGFA